MLYGNRLVKMAKLSHPFSMLVSGGRGVGKTVFTKKLLKNRETVIDNPPKRVVWCYAKHQPTLLDELLEIVPEIEYVEGIPENLDSMFDRKSGNIVILLEPVKVISAFQNCKYLKST